MGFSGGAAHAEGNSTVQGAMSRRHRSVLAEHTLTSRYAATAVEIGRWYAFDHRAHLVDLVDEQARRYVLALEDFLDEVDLRERDGTQSNSESKSSAVPPRKAQSRNGSATAELARHAHCGFGMCASECAHVAVRCVCDRKSRGGMACLVGRGVHVRVELLDGHVPELLLRWHFGRQRRSTRMRPRCADGGSRGTRRTALPDVGGLVPHDVDRLHPATGQHG